MVPEGITPFETSELKISYNENAVEYTHIVLDEFEYPLTAGSCNLICESLV